MTTVEHTTDAQRVELIRNAYEELVQVATGVYATAHDTYALVPARSLDALDEALYGPYADDEDPE